MVVKYTWGLVYFALIWELMQIFGKDDGDFDDKKGIKLGLSRNKSEILNALYISRSN